MRRCPFCAEEIQDAAIKCRYCGEFLDGRPWGRGGAKTARSPSPGGGEGTGGKWYHSWSAALIGIALVGPLALPLVWMNPKWSVLVKALVTAGTIVFTLMLVQILRDQVERLNEVWRELNALSPPRR